MTINTHLFGEVEVDESKKITFDGGIIGFSEMNHFMLMHDVENDSANISWLQSIDEPEFAMPVIDPLLLFDDYNPEVEDEILKPLGGITENSMFVLVTMTVPSDITKMTANLKAPIIINADNLKACQLIIDDDKYIVKHPVYEILKAKKED